MNGSTLAPERTRGLRRRHRRGNRLGPGRPNGAVTALAVDGSTVDAAGSFTTVNGSTGRNRLAAFDAVTGSATAWAPALPDPNLLIRALVVSGPTVYEVGPISPSPGVISGTSLAGFDAGTGAVTGFDLSFTGGLTFSALDVSAERGVDVGGDANLLVYPFPPGPPTAATATAGVESARVGFAGPTAIGGAPVTSYTVTPSPGGPPAIGATSPITVTGLTPGTSYTFTVTAANSAGSGPASAPTAAVVPASARSTVALEPPPATTRAAVPDPPPPGPRPPLPGH